MNVLSPALRTTGYVMTDKAFTSIMLISLVAVLAAVALDIYQHPADPKVVGTAAVEV